MISNDVNVEYLWCDYNSTECNKENRRAQGLESLPFFELFSVSQNHIQAVSLLPLRMHNLTNVLLQIKYVHKILIEMLMLKMLLNCGPLDIINFLLVV